jgi:flavin-binding protein dodecin
MAYADKEGKLLDAVVLSANRESDALDVRGSTGVGLALVWASAAAATAVVKLQESMDGTTWFDVASQTQTLTVGAGIKKFSVTTEMPYLKAVCTKNTETTAVVTVRYYARGR